MAKREATFTVTSTGSVWFTIPYTLSYTASSASLSWADALASYRILLVRDITGDLRESTEATGDVVSNGQSSSDSAGSNIRIELTGFRANDTGSILFEVNTVTDASAVPIPAGLWLLGSGLVGLVGIRRKVTKA